LGNSIPQILEAGLKARQRAVLGLALSFFTWRALVQDGELTTPAAVELMVEAIACLT
jgi:hypothetical protein